MPQSNTKYDRYNHSVKGIARGDRHRQTEKYRLSLERFYAKHSGKRAYDAARYYMIQEEAGCHARVVDFYPAYRFLQALVNAEVVEA